MEITQINNMHIVKIKFREGTGTTERSCKHGEGCISLRSIRLRSHSLGISCPCTRRGSVQFQVIHVLLDPGFTGVGTDLSSPFGLESVEQGVIRTPWSLVCGRHVPLLDHGSSWTAPVGMRPFLGWYWTQTPCTFHPGFSCGCPD